MRQVWGRPFGLIWGLGVDWVRGGEALVGGEVRGVERVGDGAECFDSVFEIQYN